MGTGMQIDASSHTDAGQRRCWWVSFAVLVAIGTSWALASPLFSYPDEPSHVIYAAGAVRGELFGAPDGVLSDVSVPASYAAIDLLPCYAFKPDKTAACVRPIASNIRGQIDVGTSAGRYPPAYYLYAGLPSLFATGGLGIYLMRLLTVLLCAALIASAIASARVRTRSPWPIVGLLLALTPMALYFTGGVNPQGPEIAAGIGLWSAGFALFGRSDAVGAGDTRMRTRLILRVIAAAAVLAIVRPISPLWLFLIAMFVLTAYGQWGVVRALAIQRMVKLGLALVVLLGAGTVSWVVLRAFLQTERTNFAYLSGWRAADISFSRLGYWLRQMVGVFGWLDTDASPFTYIVWTALLGLLLLLALACGRRRELAAMGGLILVGGLIPIASELASYGDHGFGWQGRYILPLLVGVPILAGHMLRGTDVLGRKTARRLVAMLVVLAALAHFFAFRAALDRFAHGITDPFSLAPIPPSWGPPFGYATLIFGYGVGMAVAVAVTMRALPSGYDPVDRDYRRDGNILGVPAQAFSPAQQCHVTIPPRTPDRSEHLPTPAAREW